VRFASVALPALRQHEAYSRDRSPLRIASRERPARSVPSVVRRPSAPPPSNEWVDQAYPTYYQQDPRAYAYYPGYSGYGYYGWRY
jgi:hypothetical protein